MVRRTILLGLFFSGCASARDWWAHATRKGDPAPGESRWQRRHFPIKVLVEAHNRRVLEAAAMFWEAHVGYTIWDVHVSTPYQMLGYPAPGSISVQSSPGPARGTDVARVWPLYTGEHYMNSAIVEAPFGSKSVNRLLAHELGHVLGLGHSTLPDALMRHDSPGWTVHPDEVEHIRSQVGG